jgi:hypothetical protein
MADFTLVGFIRAIKYMDDSVLVFIDEYKNGYKKSNGEYVQDRYISWRCIFKSYFKKYVSEHFGNGMLVQVKGEVLPYAVEHGESVAGYTVMGQTLNMASYPKSGAKAEIKRIKDGLSNADEVGKPDLESYNESDF